MELTRADGSPLRVLVVDDEVNIAELITMALRYEGFEVQAAHSGTKAVAAAKEMAPDAVVLDIMLPDIDGLEVLRRMRTTDPHLPVVFLTARDAVEDRIAGLTAGGDDYVTKPFSLEELVARRTDDVVAALAATDRDVVLVTNEVGLGVVPAHRSGRVFRDLLGAVNQQLGAACDEVHLVIAGRVLVL